MVLLLMWDSVSLQQMQLQRRLAVISLCSQVLPRCHRLHSSPTRPALPLAPPTSQHGWVPAVPLAVPVRISMGLKQPLHLSSFPRAVQLASKSFPPSPRALPQVTYFPPGPDLPREVISSPNFIWRQPGVPAACMSVVSSIAGFTVGPSSSDSLDLVTRPPPPATAPSSTSIKDKPSNLGIKAITDKESWIDAKKIINAWLFRAPYWLGELKELVTTDANAAVSVWWEEVIAFYCKHPVSDLFVEECRFSGKGFEMVSHIGHHFNPSGAVNSLDYIFNFIDIKQLDQEFLVTLKAPFSRLFSDLEIGGIGIDSALQVEFMLCTLL
jgi:hypothetical protein